MLLHAPEDFLETLGDLPNGVKIQKRPNDKTNVSLWFVRSLKDLESDLDFIASFSDNRSVWIIWPKRASGVATDAGENAIRSRALTTGMVDYKVCSVDRTWSGLLFTRNVKKTQQ